MTKQELQDRIAAMKRIANSKNQSENTKNKAKTQIEKLESELAELSAKEDMEKEKEPVKEVKKQPTKTIRFTKSDYAKLVEDKENDYPFFGTKDGYNYVIKSDKAENTVAKWDSKKQILSYYNYAEITKWLSDNSFLKEKKKPVKKTTKKVTVKPEPKTEPAPKKEPKKYTPFRVSELVKEQSVTGNYKLHKVNEKLYELIKKGETQPAFEFEKKADGKWYVQCKIDKRRNSFASLQGAVNYVAKTLYAGELKEYKDAEKHKAEKAKERAESREDAGLPPELTVREVVENEVKKVKDKLEDKANDGKSVKRDLKAIINNTKELIIELREYKAEIDKTEVRELIKELKKLIE